MTRTITAKDLLITEGILTCAPSATLSQALAKLNSSHDAVFVVSDKNKLLGVISPYYVLFQSNYPPTTKVENCLYSPPKLKLSIPIAEIARHMMQSKVYFLPVFTDSGQWQGMVSVRAIMKALVEDKTLFSKLEFPKRTKRMITIGEQASLNEAKALLRNEGVSRLPVVDVRGKLVGILTRYDLRQALAAPRSSQRFHSRQGQKKKYLNQPIRSFYKRAVVTASHKAPEVLMINEMLEKRIGSIIIINAKWQPVGLVSYHDILEALSRLEFERGGKISIMLPDDFIDETEIMALTRRLFIKLQKQDKANRLKLRIDAIKNPAQKTKRFNATLTTFHPKLGSYIGKGSDHRWKTAVRQAMERVETQARRK
ncbi:CBS domain-containing protein [Patescibacteria group bacterium]|nr:CBS domain-containing protein [Patescibacteria group bacterium]